MLVAFETGGVAKNQHPNLELQLIRPDRVPVSLIFRLLIGVINLMTQSYGGDWTSKRAIIRRNIKPLFFLLFCNVHNYAKNKNGFTPCFHRCIAREW